MIHVTLEYSLKHVPIDLQQQRKPYRLHTETIFVAHTTHAIDYNLAHHSSALTEHTATTVVLQTFSLFGRQGHQQWSDMLPV